MEAAIGPGVGLIFDGTDAALAKRVADELEIQKIPLVSLHELKPGQHAGRTDSDIHEELFHRELLFCVVLISEKFNQHLNKDSTLRSAMFESRKSRPSYFLPVQVTAETAVPPVLSDLKTFDLSSHGEVSLLQAIVARLPATAAVERPYALSPYSEIQAVISVGEPTRVVKPLGVAVRLPIEGVGFEVYQAENPIRSHDHVFYLHLYRNAGLEATCGAFKSFAREHAIKSDKLIVLLEKEPNVRRSEDRLKNVQTMLSLKPEDVYYVDDYLFTFSLELDHSSTRSKWPIPNYVPAQLTTQSSRNEDGQAYLKSWSLAPNRPVLAIKAPGGIGKTTLIRHFANTVIESQAARLVYVDAATIVEHLSKITNPPTIASLQDLFLLCTRQPFGTGYTTQAAGDVEDLVRINYDYGKLVFIVDGLDELISRLDLRFEVAHFLQSLHDCTKASGLGKVLVTCRDYFWDVNSSAFNVLIESCELQPFDLSQAQKFFDNEFLPWQFPNHKLLRERAMNEVAFIQGNASSPTFLPYILDVVAKVMKTPHGAFFSQSAATNLSDDTTAISPKRDITIGRVTHQICQREVQRFREAALPVDEQMLVLAALAAEETGPRYKATTRHERTFSDVCAEAIGRPIPERQLENLRGHTLLESEGDSARFRYDFFQEYFIQRYMQTFLTTDKRLTDREVRIISTYFDFGSAFLRNLVDAMNHGLSSATFEFRALSLIEDLLSKQSAEVNGEASEHDVFAYQRARAGITNLMLGADVGPGGAPTVDQATNVAKLLFGRSDNGGLVIDGLCVRNITAASGRPVTFNFEGTVLRNCSFENYEYFWKCKFDNKTRFESSRFIHLGRARKSDINITMANFSEDNRLDEDALEALQELHSNIGRTAAETSEALVKFLSLFRAPAGTYTDNFRETDLQRGRYAKLKMGLPYPQFIQILERNRILQRYDHRGHDYVKIRPTAHVAVALLVEQGLLEGPVASARQELERVLLGMRVR